MGGPGLLATLGSARQLSKVDLPLDTRVFVDIEAFHFDIVRIIYHSMNANSLSDVTSTAKTIAKMLLERFHNSKRVEFFMDGPSSKEKLETSLARRRANRFNDAIALVSKMEQNAALGLGLKKSDYKKVAAVLKASTPISLPIKEAIIQQLQEAGAKATLCQGEADIGIRVRSRELRFSLNPREMVDVVAHDVDYCANKRIRNILRPYGKKYVKYDIDNLLADAGLPREQFKILSRVTHGL